MILDPVFPVSSVVILAVALGGFSFWQLVAKFRITKRNGSAISIDWALRLVMVVLLVIIALRPSIPGDGSGPSANGGLEVYFMVDTTSSMAAEDLPQEGSAADDVAPDGAQIPVTRLDVVKSDIGAIAADLPGALFSLTTFDASAVQRVPVTTDATALASATSALTQETTYYSQGSSIDAALPFMLDLLEKARQEHPERRRVVFYLGDGEQTSDAKPGSFVALAPLVSGGAVLGYGTDDGGRMRAFDGYAADDDPSMFDYIPDPATGMAAISRIDESNLSDIGAQLGVDYHRRVEGEPLGDVLAGLEVGDVAISPGSVTPPVEYYWMFALPLALLALREALVIGAALVGSRPPGVGGRRHRAVIGERRS